MLPKNYNQPVREGSIARPIALPTPQNQNRVTPPKPARYNPSNPDPQNPQPDRPAFAPRPDRHTPAYYTIRSIVRALTYSVLGLIFIAVCGFMYVVAAAFTHTP